MAQMTNKELAAILLHRLDNRENDYNESINVINTKLDKIQEQTTKTNGRVTRLEDHEAICPIKDVKKQTEVIRFFYNYPKIMYFIIALIVLVTGFNSLEIIISLIKIL